MDLGIRNKRALVTGGSSGIGKACAIELAREGARVCIVARDEARMAEVVEAIRRQGGEAMSVSADLSTESGCQSAVDACVSQWHGIDILINVAGAARNVHVLKGLTPEIISEGLALKAYGYLRLSQMVFPHMRAQGWGRIVNVAGAAATLPNPENLPASFANVIVINMAQALSEAGIKDGILVNTICPGLTNTPRKRRHVNSAAEREGRVLSKDEVEEAIRLEAEALPAGRMCEPEEVARVACFLASEACSYVQASVVYMDGGERWAPT